MDKKNILVFPCGSEVALEIFRSLEHSIHVNLIGGNSVDDHGKFIYKQYIGDIPFLTDNKFIFEIKNCVKKYNIDAIYPATDMAIYILKKHEEEIGCKIISSPLATVETCLSKAKTYNKLNGIVEVPNIFTSIDEIDSFPIFLKPDIGYGSKGVKKATNKDEIKEHKRRFQNLLILEYLPGKEYTVDCFSNSSGEILFTGVRERKRISKGISVNTSTSILEERFLTFAKKINENLALEGAWFFQVKERNNNTLVLMEVATRLGGSSAVYRMQGINFALLSIFNAFDVPVSIEPNYYKVEMDRAFDCKFKLSLSFNHIYIDFDDVIILNEKVNIPIIAAIYHFINEGKKIYLITKHTHNIEETLEKYRLTNIFDKVIHIESSNYKWKYIKHKDAIFIDDSFQERHQVKTKLSIPVFSPDMVSGLID